MIRNRVICAGGLTIEPKNEPIAPNGLLDREDVWLAGGEDCGGGLGGGEELTPSVWCI